jgi:hypothetical protein
VATAPDSAAAHDFCQESGLNPNQSRAVLCVVIGAKLIGDGIAALT